MLSAAVPADVILFSFLLLTSSSFFQSAAVPGWTFNEYQHSSKPCSSDCEKTLLPSKNQAVKFRVSGIVI
ncbi:MAG: hypothetical protein K2Q24_18105, partial [Chitinophagaceae bacterium]|nr:hypothetical protein [Chitinophagaceae bacterium]